MGMDFVIESALKQGVAQNDDLQVGQLGVDGMWAGVARCGGRIPRHGAHRDWPQEQIQRGAAHDPQNEVHNFLQSVFP